MTAHALSTNVEVFYSYAHEDERLRRELEKHLSILRRQGIVTAWHDRQIRPGSDWKGEIDSHLDSASIILLLISADFLASDYCYDVELKRAMQRHSTGQARVIPIILRPVDWTGAPFGSLQVLPRDAKPVTTWQSVDEAFENVAQGIRAVAEEISGRSHRHGAVLSRVPEIPPHYVLRAEQLAQLKHTIITNATSSSRPIPIGFHGMGGIGKSVLAAALARDTQVHRAFPDGVFWVTVGQTPDLPTLQLQLARDIGAYSAAFDNTHDGKSLLRQLFANRACMLILDDVWLAEHVAAFDVLHPGSSLVFTTRDATTITDVGALEVCVDLLSDVEATQLLAAWAGVSHQPRELDLLQVVHACGRLPLALSVCGAMIRDGVSWSDLVEALEASDLSFLDRSFPGYLYPNVAKSLHVSVQALKEQSSTSFVCYSELAVFPPDEAVPESVVVRLWNHTSALRPREARRLVTVLDRKCLLRASGEGANRHITLHRLQHDYLKATSKNVADIHGHLVDAYRGECGGDWDAAPDDGYLFEHLLYHLAEAGLSKEAESLLLDFGWVSKKVQMGQTAALIADYDRVEGNAALRLVQSALRLSAHVLGQEWVQLPSQLLGRLGDQSSSDIRHFLHDAGNSTPFPWLRPLTASLVQPGAGLVRTFIGHRFKVNALDVSVDERYVVSGSSDCTVRLWDVRTGEVKRVLRGHDGPVNAVVMTHDRRRIISGGDDNLIKVWELDSGTEVYTFSGHESSVRCLSVVNHGDMLISGSDDCTVRLWHPSKKGGAGELLGRHRGAVVALAIARTGDYAVSAGLDRVVKVWDVSAATERWMLPGMESLVRGVAITAMGRVVTVSDDGKLRLWDLALCEECGSVELSTAGVRCMAVTADGDYAVVGGMAGSVYVWDLHRKEEETRLIAHQAEVNALAVTRDGRKLFSASSDTRIKLWDLETQTTGNAVRGHRSAVLTVAAARDARHAVSGGSDKTIRLWNVQDGGEGKTLCGHVDWVLATAISHDGRHIASGSDDCTVKIWDVASGQELLTLLGHDGAVNALAITPDGRFVVSGSLDETIKVWDLSNGKERRTVRVHDSGVYALAVTPDGRYVVSGSLDDSVKVWELETGKEVHVLRGHLDGVNAIAVTADGQQAISGSLDRTLKVWDLRSGKEKCTLVGHSSAVLAVALTHDDLYAVSGSFDCTIRVWDIGKKECLARFNADSSVECCAIGGDGRTIVAGDRLGHVHFLRIESPSSFPLSASS